MKDNIVDVLIIIAVIVMIIIFTNVPIARYIFLILAIIYIFYIIAYEIISKIKKWLK